MGDQRKHMVARRKRVAEAQNGFAGGAVYLADQLRRDSPGQWTDNRIEQSNHYRGVIYIAIRAIMDAVLSSTIQINKKHRRFSRISLARLEKALPTPHANSQDEQFRPFDDEDHSLVKLIDQPNRTETFNELLSQLVLQYHLTGSGLMWANPNKLGVPAELYVLPTALCYPQPPNPSYPEGWWRVTQYYPAGGFGILPSPIAGGGVPVDGRDIFSFKNPHPLWRWDAMSPLSAGSVQLDILESIDQARWTAMDQGLTPDMVLLAPGVNQAQLDTYLERLKGTNIGKRNFRKVMAIGGDQGDSKFDVKFPSTTAKDMDFSGGWDQMTAYALALFGVPKSVAGLATTGSYAELYAALKQFHTLTLRPLVQRLGVWLTRHLARIWSNDLAIQLDLPTIDDQQLQEAQLGTDLAHDGVTYNEYRAIRGRKPVPGGDVLVSVYVQKMQAKAQQEQQAAQAPPPADPNAAPAPGGDAAAPAPGGDPNAGATPQPSSPNGAPAPDQGQPQPGQPSPSGDPLSALLGQQPPDQGDQQHARNAVTDAALAGLGVPQSSSPNGTQQKAYEPVHVKGVKRAPNPKTGVPKTPGATLISPEPPPVTAKTPKPAVSDGNTKAGEKNQDPGSSYQGPKGETYKQTPEDTPARQPDPKPAPNSSAPTYPVVKPTPPRATPVAAPVSVGGPGPLAPTKPGGKPAVKLGADGRMTTGTGPVPRESSDSPLVPAAEQPKNDASTLFPEIYQQRQEPPALGDPSTLPQATYAHRQEGDEFRGPSGHYFKMKGGRPTPIPDPADRSHVPAALLSGQHGTLSPSDMDAAVEKLKGGWPSVNLPGPTGKPVPISTGNDLRAHLSAGGDLGADAKNRLSILSAKPIPFAEVKAAVASNTLPDPAKFESAAALIPNTELPSVRQTLATAHQWAGAQALRDSQRVADHFGIEHTQAFLLLQHAILAVATKAAERSAKAPDGAPAGASATLAPKSGAAAPVRVTFDPANRRSVEARRVVTEMADHMRDGNDLSAQNAAEFAAHLDHLKPDEVTQVANTIRNSMSAAEVRENAKLMKMAKELAAQQEPEAAPTEPSSAAVRHPVVEKMVSGIHGSAKLSPEQKQQYSAAVDRVTGAMPSAAHERIAKNLTGATFHPSTKDIMGAVVDSNIAHEQGAGRATPEQVEKYRQDMAARVGGKPVAGAYMHGPREMHVDGDDAHGIENGPRSGRYPHSAGGVEPKHAIYAHELGHAIDGPNHEVSGTAEWKKAFGDEIAQSEHEYDNNTAPKLSHYATAKPSEGFAEFARLVYGSDVPHAQIEREFPQATAVFKAHGLWPETPRGGSQGHMPEMFDKRVQVSKDGSHLDTLLTSTPQPSSPNAPPGRSALGRGALAAGVAAGTALGTGGDATGATHGDPSPVEPNQAAMVAPAPAVPNPVHPDQPPVVPFKPVTTPGLSPEDAKLEQESQKYAHENYDKIKAAYLKENATPDDQGGYKSVVLNTDEWRHHLPGYTGTNAGAVHEAASTLNKRLTAEVMKSQAGKGNGKLLILAGGGGSGKGTATKQFFDQNQYPLVLDQVSGDLKKLEAKLDEAKAAGYEPEYTFVDRKPEDAAGGVVQRAMNLHAKGKIPRTVELDRAIEDNIAARKTALALLQKRQDIKPKILDNTNGDPADRRLITDRDEAIKFLKSRVAEEERTVGDGLPDRLAKSVLDRHASDEIPEPIARGLVGSKKFGELANERNRISGSGSVAPDDTGRTGGVGPVHAGLDEARRTGGTAGGQTADASSGGRAGGIADEAAKPAAKNGPSLSPAAQRMSDLVDDPAKADAAYNKLPDAKGGKVINTDTARELMPEFASGPAGAVRHSRATAKIASRYAFNRLMRELKDPKGRKSLLILAGGPAAGKSSSLDPAKLASSDLVWDTTLTKGDRAKHAIETAIENGWHVNVHYVHAHPEAYAKGLLDRTQRGGRWSDNSSLGEDHRQAQQNVLASLSSFEGDPRVKFDLYHNPHSDAKPTTLSPEDIKEGGKYHHGPDLPERTQAAIDKLSPNYHPDMVSLGSGKANAEEVAKRLEANGGKWPEPKSSIKPLAKMIAQSAIKPDAHSPGAIDQAVAQIHAMPAPEAIAAAAKLTGEPNLRNRVQAAKAVRDALEGKNVAEDNPLADAESQLAQHLKRQAEFATRGKRAPGLDNQIQRTRDLIAELKANRGSPATSP